MSELVQIPFNTRVRTLMLELYFQGDSGAEQKALLGVK